MALLVPDPEIPSEVSSRSFRSTTKLAEFATDTQRIVGAIMRKFPVVASPGVISDNSDNYRIALGYTYPPDSRGFDIQTRLSTPDGRQELLREHMGMHVGMFRLLKCRIPEDILPAIDCLEAIVTARQTSEWPTKFRRMLAEFLWGTGICPNVYMPALRDFIMHSGSYDSEYPDMWFQMDIEALALASASIESLDPTEAFKVLVTELFAIRVSSSRDDSLVFMDYDVLEDLQRYREVLRKRSEEVSPQA